MGLVFQKKYEIPIEMRTGAGAALPFDKATTLCFRSLMSPMSFFILSSIDSTRTCTGIRRAHSYRIADCITYAMPHSG